MSALPTERPRTARGSFRKWLGVLLVAVPTLGLLAEAFLQFREQAAVHLVAESIVREAGAKTDKEKVLALRDYLRSHIRYQSAPTENRPFFRASAIDTLQSGTGYCGEVSRTFICLAEAAGIEASRINLYGKKQHVVAEASIGDEGFVIVDCQYPPTVADLEPLDDVIRRPDYDDYSTLNLRRLGLNWLFSRIKIRSGLLTYLFENPHALAASLWGTLLVFLMSVKVARWSLRQILLRRGWVHTSDH